MILFLNGAFGVGKSTVAEELKKIIPASSLCDLEDLGPVAKCATDRALKDVERTDDFQDIPLWRVLSAAMLRHLADQYPANTFIVPMTIGRPDYFFEVTDGVRDRPDFSHFCLVAPLQTIRARLASRGDSTEPHSWGIRKAEHYVPSFESEVFREHVPTADRSPVDIARRICELSGFRM